VTRVWLVRHSEASAHWGQDLDPALSPQGIADAAAAVDLLHGVGPLPVVTSPMKRTRQTAGAFASAWGVEVAVEPAVSEVPSPTSDLAQRQQWLGGFLASGWSTQPDDLWTWRRNLLRFVRSLTAPTVVVTHAVAINTVLAEANNDEAVFTSAVAPGSVTVVDIGAGDAGLLSVVALGVVNDAARVW
jgi:broad specificity phosphatase PhoE